MRHGKCSKLLLGEHRGPGACCTRDSINRVHAGPADAKLTQALWRSLTELREACGGMMLAVTSSRKHQSRGLQRLSLRAKAPLQPLDAPDSTVGSHLIEMSITARMKGIPEARGILEAPLGRTRGRLQ